MSASPRTDDPAERQDQLEGEPTMTGEEMPAGSSQQPVQKKRGRGRPPGSKNKKKAAAAPIAGPSSSGVQKKRGRPRKVPANDDSGPAPKRAKPDSPSQPAGEKSTEGEPQKKKRGRPKKTTST